MHLTDTTLVAANFLLVRCQNTPVLLHRNCVHIIVEQRAAYVGGRSLPQAVLGPVLTISRSTLTHRATWPLGTSLPLRHISTAEAAKKHLTKQIGTRDASSHHSLDATKICHTALCGNL